MADTETFAERRVAYERLESVFQALAPCSDNVMNATCNALAVAEAEVMAFPAGSAADLKFKLGVMMRAAERGDQSSTEWLAAVLADFDQLIPA